MTPTIKYYCMYVIICANSILIDQSQISTKNSLELAVLQHFYRDLQNLLPIDELLPQLVTQKIVTIIEKMTIAESGKNVNERSQYFLHHYISRPLSAGDPTAFYKLLQIMDTSLKCVALATTIKQCLNVRSLQDKITGKFFTVAKDSISICCCVFIIFHIFSIKSNSIYLMEFLYT